MAKRTEELYDSASATAGADGVAEARLQPSRAFEDWKITGATVQSNSATESVARMYRAGVTASNLIGGSYSGNFDTGSSGGEMIRNGVAVITRWEGCTPGAVCTVVITGERIIG